MPVETMPLTIEVSDFLGGYAPDGENATTASDVLIDVLNMLPDRNTGSLQTRKGFRRLREELGGLTTHTLRSIHRYFTAGESYAIIVTCLTTGASAVNNVRIYAITLSTLGVARIDTAGVNWDNPLEPHWGASIDGIYYGGSKGNPMYSWDGTTYDADATSATRKTLVDDTDVGVDTSTEYARDYAFNGKELVSYAGEVFKPNRSIRYDTWESGEHYSKGDRVSIRRDWASGPTVNYWKSFKCIKSHTAAATNRPGDGTVDPLTYWEKVRLPLAQDEDSETVDSWNFVVTAAETSIATWHGNRLWLRFDGQGDNSRVQYSKPVRPEKGEDIPSVSWDPTDFSPADDISGVGGGWLALNDGSRSAQVTALYSYGAYLLLFQRTSVWALSGQDDDTWTLRRVARGNGAISHESVVEVDGLVYFLGDNGLYVTDGTTAEPVEGNERVQEWLRTRLDSALIQAATDKRWPDLWTFGGFVWMSIPDASAAAALQHVTLVYDPRTQGFWRLNLPVVCARVLGISGVARMFFGAPSTYATSRDLLYEYGHATAADTDDDGADTYGTTAIAWHVRTAWWNFSTLRQDRRVRRVWASVKGAITYTLTAYRNWSDTSVAATARTPGVSTPVHIEGEWIADSHAVNFKVSGAAAPATLMGIAVDTEPRRTRYHV